MNVKERIKEITKDRTFARRHAFYDAEFENQKPKWHVVSQHSADQAECGYKFPILAYVMRRKVVVTGICSRCLRIMHRQYEERALAEARAIKAMTRPKKVVKRKVPAAVFVTPDFSSGNEDS